MLFLNNQTSRKVQLLFCISCFERLIISFEKNERNKLFNFISFHSNHSSSSSLQPCFDHEFSYRLISASCLWSYDSIHVRALSFSILAKNLLSDGWYYDICQASVIDTVKILEPDQFVMSNVRSYIHSHVVTDNHITDILSDCLLNILLSYWQKSNCK